MAFQQRRTAFPLSFGKSRDRKDEGNHDESVECAKTWN
jgi:hypothetical protein